MGSLGPFHWLIVAAIVFLLFGNRLPSVMRSLGQGVAEEAAAVLLAHVLAHEITHVLQGTVRHSEEGLMKARWTAEDRMSMRVKPLPFTAYDIQLIQSGMANCARLQAASR